MNTLWLPILALKESSFESLCSDFKVVPRDHCFYENEFEHRGVRIAQRLNFKTLSIVLNLFFHNIYFLIIVIFGAVFLERVY